MKTKTGSTERSWVREADEYVCRLSEETQRIAAEELQETPLRRTQALDQMRDWIAANSRITNCRLDSNFLLRFLRAKKFSVVQACEALERYLLLRQTMAMGFRVLDIKLPVIDELMSQGLTFALPQRDRLGRRVIFSRPGVIDPHKQSKEDLCRAVGIMQETLMEDEENQVRGLVYITDGAGVGFPHLTLFTPTEAVRIVKNGERTLPIRHKEIHGLNAHSSLKFVLDFGTQLLSDKLKKRVKIYTCLKDAEEHIDTHLLPKEYGGKVPMSEMITLWRQEMNAARPTLLSHDNMSVQTELFSEQARIGAVSALRNGNTCSSFVENNLVGVAGSFRKLEID